MKTTILTLLSCILLNSCASTYLMDKQAREDYRVCTSACLISTSIREDESRLAAYQKASDLLTMLLAKDPITTELTREAFKTDLTRALDKLFNETITKTVVNEIMKIYDENLGKIHENAKLMLALESTKSSIDSGIRLAIKTGRPVSIITKH